MTTTAQTYRTHAHRPTAAGVAGLFAGLALVLYLVDLVRSPSIRGMASLCLVGAVFALVAISRVYIVRLQDRIIRLEMRLRLEHRGLGAAFMRLSTPQIVALRFAGDAELPQLVERAVAEGLTRDQIKQAIGDWQPDPYRT